MSKYPLVHLEIAALLEKGEKIPAMELVGQAIRRDCFTFTQILTGLEWNDQRLRGVLDMALEYYVEKEDYELCKRIQKCREFLEFRRADEEFRI